MQHLEAIDNRPVVIRDEVDENGEPRRQADRPDPSISVRRLTILAKTMDTAQQRRAVWREDPCCVNCEAWIESPDSTAIVNTETGPRLACLPLCFAEAMQAHHPELAVGAAFRRAARETR
jgi:hypothetical protein